VEKSITKYVYLKVRVESPDFVMLLAYTCLYKYFSCSRAYNKMRRKRETNVGGKFVEQVFAKKVRTQIGPAVIRVYRSADFGFRAAVYAGTKVISPYQYCIDRENAIRFIEVTRDFKSPISFLASVCEDVTQII